MSDDMRTSITGSPTSVSTPSLTKTESIENVHAAEVKLDKAVANAGAPRTAEDKSIEGETRTPFVGQMLKNAVSFAVKTLVTVFSIIIQKTFSFSVPVRTSESVSRSSNESKDGTTSVDSSRGRSTSMESESVRKTSFSMTTKSVSPLSSPDSSVNTTLKATYNAKIDQYSVGKFEGKEAIGNELKTYLGKEGIEALNKGCDNPPSMKAREAFNEFLLSRIPEMKASTIGTSEVKEIDKPPISLSKFLGAEGAKLYEAAMAEEHNSKEFRAAVYLESSSKRGDKEVAPKFMLVVGPSAAGKSSGLEAVTQEIFPEAKKGVEGKNKLTAVDGAIERGVSHTSHLLLNVALKMGYQGIDGLHYGEDDKTVKSVKKQVLAAVKANEEQNITIIMPETFSKYGIGGNLLGNDKVALSRLQNDGPVGASIKYAHETEREAILIGIVGKDPKDFQDSVAVKGDSRSMAKIGSKTLDISPETKLPCESKRYGASGFGFGKEGSKAATQAFRNEAVNYPMLVARQFAITDDLVAYKKDPSDSGKKWEPVRDVKDARANSGSAVLLSKPLKELWNTLPDMSSETGEKYKSHENEFNKYHEKNDLAGFSSYCRKNNIPGVNMEEIAIPGAIDPKSYRPS